MSPPQQPQPHRLRWVSLALAASIAVLTVACEDEATQPEDDSLVLPVLSAPESVLSAIQVIYNDRDHSADERLAAYASLFDSTFIFRLQPADVQNGLPASWGLDLELAGHAGIFAMQSAGDIYSIDLRITHDQAQDLTPPEVGREGWQEVFATNIYLRIMFNPQDGLEVSGAQGEFLFPPAVEGRYRIADWTDLPRPNLGATAVEARTWGNIKNLFIQGLRAWLNP